MESLAEVEAELRAFDWDGAYARRHAQVQKLGWVDFKDEATDTLSSSSRFAVELGLDELVIQRCEAPHPWLAAKGTRVLLTAAVLPVVDFDWFLAASKEAIEKGAQTLKIKVGRDWGLERRALREIRERYGPRVRIRVDANGCLASSRADLVERLTDLARWGVEFVEEACGLSELPGLRSPVPLALDESLAPGESETGLGPLAHPDVNYAVIKPMLVGGLWRAAQLAESAQAADCEVVVSHLVDGPIAYEAYARFAQAVGGSCAMGLGPHGGLWALGNGTPAWAEGYALRPPSRRDGAGA